MTFELANSANEKLYDETMLPFINAYVPGRILADRRLPIEILPPTDAFISFVDLFIRSNEGTPTGGTVVVVVEELLDGANTTNESVVVLVDGSSPVASRVTLYVPAFVELDVVIVIVPE